MSFAGIRLRGLRAGNLKDLDLDLQRGAWTAVHGPSGAGKSALLFGVLEPVSRKRFEILENPRALPGQEESWLAPLADVVEGLEPVVASAGEIPRGRRKASLGSVLDLFPLLRKVWQEHGDYRCLSCSTQWRPATVAGLQTLASDWEEQTAILFLTQAGGMSSSALLQAGWTRYRVGDTLVRLEEAEETLPAEAWLLLDRFRWRPTQQERLRDALLTLLGRGGASRIVAGETIHEIVAAEVCPQCDNPHASHAREDWFRDVTLEDRVLSGRSWAAWMSSPLQDWAALEGLPPEGRARRRLDLLGYTGLGHLAAGRTLGSLSLGEARRLELVSWLAQVRRGQTVLLDEPGMGLHGRERQSVAHLLQELVAQGNTVFTADPAREFLEAAHHWLALGPRGGPGGGQVVGQGARAELPEEDWEEDPSTASVAKQELRFRNLKTRHLQMKKLNVPLGRLVAFCGVSGSGKTTLLEHEILPRLRAEERVTGSIPMGGVHALLERALRWSPTSTIATLSGVWQEVRAAFASSEEARIRGIEAGDLVARPGKGGCPICRGYGLDAHHLPCPECEGLGLRTDLLDLRLRNRALRDWLTVPLERLEKRLPAKGRLQKTVRHLIALGLGDRTLGERGRFLSLGERGRIALARVLSTARPGFPKLFLLDEPCLGLPVQEARRVVQLLRDLCTEGHSFWVVEHHEYLLRAADWMVEIGPGAGAEGGQLIYQGSPAGVLEQDTPTGRWLYSRRRASESPPQPPPRLEVGSVRVEEDVVRSGRRRLEQELARELAMRSPLQFDLAGLDAQQPEDLVAEGEQGQGQRLLEDWAPAAWPVAPARGTTLAQVLGLEAPIRRLVRQHGQAACTGCGGGGPWTSFEAAAWALAKPGLALFAAPLPAALLQREESASWLLAAGFRRFLRDGESFRWTRNEQQPLQEGDLVWLDRLDPHAEDSVGRLRDIAHHADLLGDGFVSVLDSENGQQTWKYRTGACRSCGQKGLEMEARLGKLKASQLPKAPLGEVLKICLEVDGDSEIFARPRTLLAGTSLLSHPMGQPWSSLTELEGRAARTAGWLLFPLAGVVLLADQPLSGLPSALARRFGQAMLTSGTAFHFTDPEGWCLESVPPKTSSALEARPDSFPMPFSLKAWCSPPRAHPDASLRSALEVDAELCGYFLKSEIARMRGWNPQDLDPTRSSLRCPACRGRGHSLPHPQWAMDCGTCFGSGWAPEMAALEERGLRWMDLGRRSVGELRDHFVDHPPLHAALRWAADLGMGDYSLETSLRRLPRGVRMLAPLAAQLARQTTGKAPSAQELRVGAALSGWIGLVAEPISSRIASLPSAHSGLEWREHHPLFTA